MWNLNVAHNAISITSSTHTYIALQELIYQSQQICRITTVAHTTADMLSMVGEQQTERVIREKQAVYMQQVDLFMVITSIKIAGHTIKNDHPGETALAVKFPLFLSGVKTQVIEVLCKKQKAVCCRIKEWMKMSEGVAK